MKMQYIVLLMIGIISFCSAELTRDSNGIVTDPVTGLQWQDDTGNTFVNWTDAIAYCENLSLGSYTDWRLPNKNELMTLIDDTANAPSINSIFINVAPSIYWSSTSSAILARDVWYINFLNGSSSTASKYTHGYTLCVRSDNGVI
jgi:hypothetical protein